METFSRWLSVILDSKRRETEVAAVVGGEAAPCVVQLVHKANRKGKRQMIKAKQNTYTS